MDPEAAGASQGLLDRKEVLGGEFALRWVGKGQLLLWGGGLSLALVWGWLQPRPPLGLPGWGGTAAQPQEQLS